MDPVTPQPAAQRPPIRPGPMGLAIPTANDPASGRQRIEAMEKMLEGLFHVPVLGRVGLDSIVGNHHAFRRRDARFGAP